LRAESKDVLVIDAGSGIRLLGKEFVKNNIFKFHMLFTHSHWDHVLGFPFFAPIYMKRTEINIMGCSFSSDSVREIIAKTMQPPGFPVKFDEIAASFEFGSIRRDKNTIGSIDITPIELSHPNGGLGYKFTEKGRVFVFLTDNELGFIHPGGRSLEEYIQFCRGADLLIHDADYNPQEYKKSKTWGHSTFKQSLELAIAAEVNTLCLFHHNQDHLDADIEHSVSECRRIISSRNLKIKCFAAAECQEIKL